MTDSSAHLIRRCGSTLNVKAEAGELRCKILVLVKLKLLVLFWNVEARDEFQPCCVMFPTPCTAALS